jgi:SAM-dependent methyltransferase
MNQIFPGRGSRFKSISDIPKNLTIWNTEQTRALHDRLSTQLGANYISSEFIDPAYSSGTIVDGVLHIDMQKTHFADESLDYVISSDVLEHVPFYKDALQETYRILKVGGAHVFTAPFYQHRFSNEERSIIDKEGKLVHFRHPWYHGDPLRPEGVLCFNVFSVELLIELEKIGFEAELHIIRDPVIGILGNNGIVLVARKVSAHPREKDLIFPDDKTPEET